MPSFNQTILMGHLTRDPQLKFLPSQTAVVEFGIAVNHKYRTASGEDREEVTFVDCACFGKRGEALSKYFNKGNPIFVEGRLKYDSWDDKQGGGKRSKLSVVVNEWQFVGGNNNGGGARTNEPDAQGAERPNIRPGRVEQRSRETVPPDDQPNYSDEQQFKDDDIPF